MTGVANDTGGIHGSRGTGKLDGPGTGTSGQIGTDTGGIGMDIFGNAVPPDVPNGARIDGPSEPRIAARRDVLNGVRIDERPDNERNVGIGARQGANVANSGSSKLVTKDGGCFNANVRKRLGNRVAGRCVASFANAVNAGAI